MPDVSTNSYTLSEVAQIVDVDEKTLHLYAHKGLLNPALVADGKARFSDVDCARLKMIKRANDIGYQAEDIFKLIGSPEEVLDVADPVSACQQFAMERYKQIFEELNDCEPLEQLNKKCDLKLLKNYLNHLDGRIEKPVPRRPARKLPLRPVTPKARLSSQATQTIPITPKKTKAKPTPTPPPQQQDPQEPSPEPRILSYSVDKLWDYVKKSDGEDDARDPAFQDETLAFDQSDETFSDSLHATQPHAETFSASPHIQRVIDSKWWSTGHKGYRKMVSKPAWRNWVFSILILALAITGMVRLFIYPTPSVTPVIEVTDDTKPPVQEPETDPDALARTDEKPAIEPAKPVEKPLDQKQPEEKRTEAPIKEKQTPAVASTKDKPLAAPPAEKPAVSEAKPPALILAKEMSLWHDSLNNTYRADFTIFKNPEAKVFEPVSGYAFVHLNTRGEEPSVLDSLLLPEGQLISGTPSEISKGANFSIRNLIKISVKTSSTIPPDKISTGKLMVYSPEGILMLEAPFNVPIRPFFAAAEETPPATDQKETTAAVPSKPPAESKPQPIPATDEQKTADSTPQPPKPEPAPREKTTATVDEKDPGTEKTMAAIEPKPAVPKTPIPPAEEIKPVVTTKRTDHPDAAIWEQKSYDAAVKGLFDRAIADASKAIQLDPGRINPYINRSWAYIEKNMFDHAINDCKTALSINPDNAYAYNNRGLAFQRSARAAKAKGDYQKACDLGLELGCQNLNSIIDQTRISALIDKSKVAFKAKDWDEVIRTTTEVLKLDGQNSVAYTNRSAAYAQKNFLVKALKDSNEAIKHDSDFSLAYNNRGYVFELMGNNSKAAADYLKSCSLGLNLGCKNFDKLN